MDNTRVELVELDLRDAELVPLLGTDMGFAEDDVDAAGYFVVNVAVAPVATLPAASRLRTRYSYS